MSAPQVEREEEFVRTASLEHILLEDPPAKRGSLGLALKELSVDPGHDSGVGSADPSPSSERTPTFASTKSDMATGPDVLSPSENLYTADRSAGVKLRMDRSTGGALAPPISVITMFRNTVQKSPHLPAIGVKRDKKQPEYTMWTYKQYYDDVWKAAKSFIKLGLEPYHGVGIIGFNSPEWFISDIAAIFAGGFATGIYTTNSPEACQYVAESCEANIIVVENDMQLQKILKVRDSLPHLKAIIQYSGEKKQNYESVLSWKEFMEYGVDVPDSDLEARISKMSPNKCCTLIYTSGTTGNPKAVMLSHDNLTWTTNVVGQMARLEYGKDALISYLPLSHIAAQAVDIYAPILYAACVYFAQPDALKGSLTQTLKEVHPTVFLGVPRVWEKMQERITEISRQNSNMKRKIGMWAKGVGLKGNMNIMNSIGEPEGWFGGWASLPWGWSLAKTLVFKKLRAALGLERCKICVSAAAPIMASTLEFFMSLDMTVTEIYGMSESTGPHTLSFPWDFKLGSVGKDMTGVETKIDNPDKDGNGEICMYGRHVFMGYLNQEDKTAEDIDKDGWLHSGDVGKKDSQGFLYITGRIKEILITAGGENVAPVPIEDMVKAELPCVANAMLVGDKRKFLSILLTLKTEVDGETTMPLDDLTSAARAWCESIGSQAKCVSDVLEKQDGKFLQEIQAGVDRANKKAVSRAQNIAKWTILPRDFSIPGGELGPTLKLKRPVVHKMYKNTIDNVYGD